MKPKNDTARAAKLTAIAGAIAESLEQHESTGSLATAICKSVQNLYQGEAIPSKEMDLILDEVSRIRGWTNKSADKRKSETRAILLASAKLPEAITRAEKSMPIPFYQAVKLARLVNGGKTAVQAAAALIAGGKSTSTKPAERSVADAWKSASVHLRRVLEHTQLPKKFRTELRLIADEFAELKV